MFALRTRARPQSQTSLYLVRVRFFFEMRGVKCAANIRPRKDTKKRHCRDMRSPS